MTCEVGEAVKAGAAVGIALGSARLEYRFGHSAIEGLVMMCGSMAWATLALSPCAVTHELLMPASPLRDLLESLPHACLYHVILA